MFNYFRSLFDCKVKTHHQDDDHNDNHGIDYLG